MRTKCRKKAQKNLFTSVFDKKAFQYKNMTSCVVYLRDAASIVREQIYRNLDEEFICTCHVCQYHSHPGRSVIYTNSYPFVESAFECSKHIFFLWRTAERNGMNFSVGCHLISSNKSQVSFLADVVGFYLLRVSLVIFSEEYRRKLIASKRTVVAYLSATLDSK